MGTMYSPERGLKEMYHTTLRQFPVPPPLQSEQLCDHTTLVREVLPTTLIMKDMHTAEGTTSFTEGEPRLIASLKLNPNLTGEAYLVNTLINDLSEALSLFTPASFVSNIPLFTKTSV
ncbi:hypothetical protein KIN20_003690 [Parelaphostrongylus tenuis]|uniref:Uncharacterized protein n=1 Tax=Parelaphostrongylus tenuis TaxID=148309 RepID=A0AAD5LZJ4_PARTN|nr:hypothetical protein KIN20_003690 [Parelaphostrongylus tenuis]